MFSRSRTYPQVWKPTTSLSWKSLRGKCFCCSFSCDKAFDLAEHFSRMHSFKVHHCQYCDRIQGGNKFKFIKHIKIHLSGVEDKNFNCYCGEKFKSKKFLSDHLLQIHNKKFEGWNKSLNEISVFQKDYGKVVENSKKNKRKKTFQNEEKTEEKYFTCHLCGKQFSHSTGLSYHLKHVHEGIKEHECDICGRKFALKAAREDHRRIHTGERPFVCHTCGKTFKAKASLYIHSKTHTDSFPHPCTYCQRRFRWRQQLLSHITTHTGEKKHFCEVCGKGFGVKNDLTRHKLVHSQDRPFLCLMCGLSFGQKRYLRNHEKTRHKKDGQIEATEPRK